MRVNIKNSKKRDLYILLFIILLISIFLFSAKHLWEKDISLEDYHFSQKPKTQYAIEPVEPANDRTSRPIQLRHSILRPVFSETRRQEAKPSPQPLNNIQSQSPLISEEISDEIPKIFGILEKNQKLHVLLLSEPNTPLWVPVSGNYNGWIVKEIKSTSVVIEKKGQTLNLKLYEAE